MKKTFILMLVLCMIFLFGCSDDGNNETITEELKTSKKAVVSDVVENLTSESKTENTTNTAKVITKTEKTTKAENDWIEIDCPACNGGKSRIACRYCDGTERMFNGKDRCSYCYYHNTDGYEFCWVCEDELKLTIVNPNKYKDAMTVSELTKEIDNLGLCPMSYVKCTSCSGKGCSACKDLGSVRNKNYGEENDKWLAELDNILDKCVCEKTYSSNSSGSSSSSSSGSNWANNYASSGSQKRQCYSCSGSGKRKCTYCGGSGGKYVRGSTPGYAGVDSVKNYEYWQDCFKCNGGGIMTCTYCNGKGTVG